MRHHVGQDLRRPPINVHITSHPLALSALARMRASACDQAGFRREVQTLTSVLMLEATAGLTTHPVRVQTPVDIAPGHELAEPVLLLPVLRAGLGMLDAATAWLPNAAVGFVGMVRNEQTLLAAAYATRLPADLTGVHVLVLDPMLATGGTLEQVFDLLVERGARTLTAVVLVTAPEGEARLASWDRDHPEVTVKVVTGARDERLNEDGYIVPGLGDAGDRLFGTAGELRT